MLNSLRFSLVVVAFALATCAEAKCGLSLAMGHATIENVPTSRIDDRLTTRYTGVRTTVDAKSTVREEGIECDLWPSVGLSVAVSGMQGLRANVDRTVYFKGIDFHGLSVGQTDLFTLNEQAKVSALRISLLEHVRLGQSFVSPFVRIGIESVRGTHSASIPLAYKDEDRDKVLALTYSKEYKKAAPYLGAGITFWRDSPISLRVEEQVLCLHPHLIKVFMVGAVAQFAF